ncbi:phosphopantetheine-binding protein [Streptomyces sp. ME03-5709C]|nr:phosphopantetheine-binding protein [Streptomyces sp. ME03-5709C]
MTATLSADHRATDGATGGRYLTTVDRLPQRPENTVNRTEAMDTVKESIARIVPVADFTGLGPDDSLREVLELDSLDFLGFVETLAARTGVDIDEDDYRALTALADSADFLVAHTA